MIGHDGHSLFAACRWVPDKQEALRSRAIFEGDCSVERPSRPDIAQDYHARRQ